MMLTPANITENFIVSADGTRVFVGAVGDPGRPALVFVELNYDRNLRYARKLEFRSKVRFDLRGHRRTGKPSTEEGYSSKKHAEDYAAVASEFKAKKPIIVGWSIGGSIPGDIAAHLPPGSLHGAVYIASHPTLHPSLPDFLRPALVPIWLSRFEERAAITDFPVAFIRLCVSRDICATESYYETTIKLNDDGADFVPENPTATYNTRSAMIGMATAMKPVHRRYASAHLGDESKILDLLADGFPILEVMGSNDAFLHCNKLVESLKPLAKNLKTFIVDEANHTPFIDNLDEVMSAILDFTRWLHSL